MRTALQLPIAAILTAVPAFPAFATGGDQTGPSETLFVAELVVLMVTGRLLGELMQRIKQPAVIGQLIAGLVLGPSLLGVLAPEWQHALFPKSAEQKAMIDAISQFGILLLLLLTGMETDLRLVRQTGRASIYVSLMGIVVPFAFGAALGATLPDSLLPDPGKRLVTSLFLGTALSIASVKIVAMLVREMNFLRRTVGQIILASAIIDDSVGWIIVSIIFSITLHGSIDVASLAWSVAGTIIFMVASFTIGRRAVFFVIRWVNDTFVSEFTVITAILVIMGVMALITDLIGVHTVLGAFVAGILIGESPILGRHIDEQLRGLITAFFAPVFFGIAGLSADLTILKSLDTAILTGGLILIASIGKFTGAFLGAELSGLTRREALALGCGMNARGSTEVIVATIGLSMGALNQDLFTMIVAMAIITTMAMPPSLRWALSRIPMRKEERQRLEREAKEEKGFVPNLERLLVAVDESASGKLAARVAGMVAGTRGMPTTVLRMAEHARNESSGRGGDEARLRDQLSDGGVEESGETVKDAAEQSKEKQKEEERAGSPVEVTTFVHEAPSAAIIGEEAEKGYGLMFIGLQNTATRNGELHPDVARLATGFDGPLAVTAARADLAENPDGKFNVLVPVNGTEAARRGAEVAIVLARATKAPVTVLYVAARDSGRKSRRSIRSRRHEEAILKDIVGIADGYNMSVRTAVLTDTAAADAILNEIERCRSNLLIVGVGRRPGDKLYFGDTAAALLADARSSLLFVAS